MLLEVDDVRAWLLELHQVEAAALLSEAEFDHTFIDLAFRLDTTNDDGIEIYELAIRVPPRIYRAMGTKHKAHADQVEAAISELTQHTKGAWIKSTSWSLRLPRLDEVETSPDVEEIFSDSSFYDVQRLWTKAKGRVINDPDGAITAARTMLESLCKVVVGENGGSFTNKDDLPTLYSKAVASLDLAPSKQTEDDYRRLAGSCSTIMNSIVCIRNREGDSHATSQTTRSLQARFVVNLAGSLVTFLIGVRNERKP